MSDIYTLYRNFWDFAFANPEKIKPTHVAIFSFAIEHCNRLGWKQKFGLPTSMAMEAIGVSSYKTYVKAFNELVEFGFIDLIEKSRNQYSSNIIALAKFTNAGTKALDKALLMHGRKQDQSTDESTASIDRQDYNNTCLQDYNNTKADDDEIDYRAVHLEFADRLLLNDLECQAIFEVSEKRVTFELLNTFVAHLTNQSKVYNQYSEFKKHFSNWMRKHEPAKENKSKVDAYLENNLAAKKILGI